MNADNILNARHDEPELRYRNGFVHHHELYPLLGLRRGQHLPPEGFPFREVQGVKFMCLPATGARSKHRILYICEACGRAVPFGRAAQHNRGAEHRLNHETMTGNP